MKIALKVYKSQCQGETLAMINKKKLFVCKTNKVMTLNSHCAAFYNIASFKSKVFVCVFKASKSSLPFLDSLQVTDINRWSS